MIHTKGFYYYYYLTIDDYYSDDLSIHNNTIDQEEIDCDDNAYKVNIDEDFVRCSCSFGDQCTAGPTAVHCALPSRESSIKT